MKKINKEVFVLVLLMILAINICHAEPKSTPPTRQGHSALYDSDRKQMIIFGGQSQGGYLSDTWVFDIEKRTWEEIPSAEETPPARQFHGAVYDSDKKQMIIFGGLGQNRRLSDTWVFDIEKKEWKKIKSKKNSACKEFSYCHI